MTKRLNSGLRSLLEHAEGPLHTSNALFIGDFDPRSRERLETVLYQNKLCWSSLLFGIQKATFGLPSHVFLDILPGATLRKHKLNREQGKGS